MKSKKFLTILSVPMLLGLLTSCGGNESTTGAEDPSQDPTTENTTVDQTTEGDPTSAGDTTSEGDPTSAGDTTSEEGDYYIKDATTIYIWTILNDTYGARMNAFIEQFKKIEPNVTIEYVKQSGSYNDLKDKIVDGFAAGNYPDLAQCYPDHVAEYIDYGFAYDLTPYMNNEEYGWTEEDYEDLIPTYLNEGATYVIDGYYSLPYCKSVEAMYYNEDVLLNSTHAAGIVAKGTELGLTINNGYPISRNYLNNLTWEECFDNLFPAIAAYNDSLAEGEKILLSDQSYHAIMGYDSDDNLFITLAEQYGYPYTSIDKTTGKGSADFNNEEMKELGRKFYDAASKGYIISKGSAGNNYTNNYFTAQNTLFSVGSTGGYFYQFSEDRPVNVGVAKIPQAAGHDTKIINQGPSMAFLNHGNTQEAANRRLASWLFYKFMTNAENSLDWTLNTGYNGIRYSNYADEDYLAQADETTQDPKTVDLLKARNMSYVGNVTDYLFTSPVFIGSSSCRNAAGGLMTKILTPTNNIEEIDTWFADAYSAATKDIK